MGGKEGLLGLAPNWVKKRERELHKKRVRPLSPSPPLFPAAAAAEAAGMERQRSNKEEGKQAWEKRKRKRKKEEKRSWECLEKKTEKQ